MARKRKGRTLNGNDVKKKNKSNNKLAKKGKLKKKERRVIGAWHRQESEKKRRTDAERMHKDLEQQRMTGEDDHDEVEEPEASPLDMVDSEDEFAKVLDLDLDLGPKPKRPRFTDSANDYDDQTRSFGKIEHGRLKHLLPIKQTDGSVVAQSMFMKEEENEEETKNADASSSGLNDKSDDLGIGEADLANPPSTAELFFKREKLLSDYKKRIASLCYLVIENPQERISKLKELLTLAIGESEPLMVRFTVQKLATASLAEVFSDIIPGYRIRLLSDEEKQQQMKKETRQLATFEEALLRYYKKYLQHLEKLCNKTAKKRKATKETNVRRKDVLGKLAVQSLSKLLTTHPHFNFRSNIIVALTPLMSDWHEEVREISCKAMEQLFRTDRVGEASLDAVKSICRHIKTNPKIIHSRMLSCFLHLRIKEVEKTDERGKSKKDLIVERKKKILAMSRKEKKMQKRLELLEKELQEVEYEQNSNAILKYHTNIMNDVFATYFRILRRSPNSKLLPAVLAGLSKFAHLINVEFVDDLVVSLRKLVESEELRPLEKLHCIRTVFVILTGDGQALTVDPYQFYVILYALMPQILQEKSREMQLKQYSISFECLDLMINRRRKQVSLSRVAAFTKRLCQLCLIMQESECVATLVVLRSFFIAHPQLEIFMDEDERMSGAYRPELDDPEHCNALGTTLINELTLLQGHANDFVKRLASYLRYKLPSQGRHRLPAEIVNAIPSEIMTKIESATENRTDFSVNSKKVVKERLKKLNKGTDQSIVEEFTGVLCRVMKFT